jgi:hypothetical protein
MNFYNYKRIFVLFVLFFCLLFAFGESLIWKTSVSSNTNDERFYSEIRNALAEINLPKSSNENEIHRAADNLADFVHYRSGLVLSRENTNLLRKYEQTARENSKRISQTALTRILTNLAVERIPTLTDSEINELAESLRGFNAPDLPVGFRRDREFVTLRASGEGRIAGSVFIAELENLRNGGVNNLIAKNLIYSQVLTQIITIAERIKKAEPTFFDDTDMSMTPMQSLLVTYAMISDDSLAYNQAGLRNRLETMQSGISKVIKESYPSPKGHRAFGENGYIYSSPLSLVMNDEAVKKLLDLIDKESKKQFV